ncbi:TIGR02587 family membrane protein [Amaricoccus sp.]|uniref:TIGR02587 family membrane protein n=1 Tax=Amaricoccus sp. TaxID=1872485 RepID=UPI001B56F3EB|nr:TIGR02587 family membrane protein [Amaricoccus sp.]MBP7003388.1 TIGR02587 family membrane protein [Amaricoccus sp.]
MAGDDTATCDADRSAADRLTGLGRAAAGALLFGLPMLMTLELWQLGFVADRLRLAILVAGSTPVLVLLAHRLGFEQTFGWRDDVRDALIAVAIGLLVSAVVLAVFRVIRPGMPTSEIVGKLALQTVPASIGALLARSQLGETHEDDDEGEGEQALSGYFGQLFLMGVGAVFLGLNIAPTDEVVVISRMMAPWHALLLVLLSIALMHAFIYALAFRGGGGPNEGRWGDFLRYTITGYALCLGISAYALWTYGRLDGLALAPAAMAIVVLGFPSALGAAAARMIL